MNYNGNWSQIQPPEALEFTREFIFTPDLLPQFVKYTGICPGMTVVDVGCGTGTFSRYLARGLENQGRLTGVDLDRKYLEYAKKKAVEAELGNVVEFVEASAYELPFADGSVDVITDHTTLINLADPDRCIHEELRVLKTGGTISTVTFLWGYFPPSRLISAPEDDELTKTQFKMYKIVKEHVFPVTPIGANDFNVYSIMERYTKLGVKDVQINGFYPVFSPDDSRYTHLRERWLTDQYRLNCWEVDNFLVNYDHYGQYGITRAELERAKELLDKRYRYELENNTWVLFNGLEIIISGKK